MTGWLRELAERVSPTQIYASDWDSRTYRRVVSEDEIRLYALAPELAKWAADAADELEWVRAGDHTDTRKATALLARLDALAPGETT